MIKAILPCAGLGTRVNTPFDKSKELHHYNGKPLIEYSLDVCKQHKLTPHVITRKEKTDLIAYCLEKNIAVQVLDKPGDEWAHTVLLSKEYWTETNFLLFPDTIWNNTSVIKDMILNLKMGNSTAFGVFEVPDQSLWSTINNYHVTEKPNVRGPGTAWGVIGFKRSVGEWLFEILRTKGSSTELITASFHRLVGFEDVTRNGVVGL